MKPSRHVYKSPEYRINTFYVKTCVSPCSSMLLSGSTSGELFLWSIENPDVEPLILFGHKDEATCVSWSPLNDEIASCSDDMTVKLWHVERDEARIDKLKMEIPNLGLVRNRNDPLVSSKANEIGDFTKTLQNDVFGCTKLSKNNINLGTISSKFAVSFAEGKAGATICTDSDNSEKENSQGHPPSYLLNFPKVTCSYSVIKNDQKKVYGIFLGNNPDKKPKKFKRKLPLQNSQENRKKTKAITEYFKRNEKT